MSPRLLIEVADSAVRMFNVFWFVAYGSELGEPRVTWETNKALDRSAVGFAPADKPNQTHAYAEALAAATH